MISINELLPFYPEKLKPFKRFILREYLQYKILEIVFESEYATKLCFLGGTCLRIVHNNQRFSEDIDFDNFSLKQSDFEKITKHIEIQLQRQGYDVEIKSVAAGAFHCYIKFPGMLFQQGLSGHVEEKILIQLDTEAQEFDFVPQQYFLNKFDVFTAIQTTPADILLAQKFYALINRPRKKGRDFYDIVFLMRKNKPNYHYLKQKIGVANRTDLKERLFAELRKTNWHEMVNDVAPFLFDASDTKKIIHFKEFINQAL